jgi:integrative and conjugative element protein (TIGR02256 family)
MKIEPTEEVLWLPEALLQTILTEMLTFSPNEAGGMLLGYVNGPHRVVTALIDAGPEAEHSRDRMLPDNTYQQAKLLSHFDQSGGRESFLGEWHSHPVSSPLMSRTDRLTLSRVSTDSKHLPALPMMMIVGLDVRSESLQIRSYRRRNSLRLLWPSPHHFLEVPLRLF